MWRLVSLTLILLCLFGRAGFAQKSDPQTKSNLAGLTCASKVDLKTFDDMLILPVRFTEYKNGDLAAQFSSPLMLERVMFLLTSDSGGRFFTTDGKWEEEVNLKTFLKKIKNDYWLVAYQSRDGKNVICEAHQFRNWEALRASYGQISDSIINSIDTIAYWKSLRERPLYFHEVIAEKAYWIFLEETDKPFVENDPGIKLENGTIVANIIKIRAGRFMRVLDHGVYKISKNCVFHTLESRGPKKINLPMTKTDFSLGHLKRRMVPVDMTYFIGSIKTSFWLGSFDKDTGTLLRAVQAPDSEETDLNKK